MTRMRLPRTLGVLVAGGALVAACGGSQGAESTADVAVPDAPPELVEAAQEEGELVFYSVPAEEATQRVADAFREAYDIQVKFVRLSTSSLAQRYSAEAQAGAPAADLALVSNSPFVTEALDSGWFVPLDEAGVPNFPGDYPEKFVAEELGTAVVQLVPSGIAYNTSKVAEGEAPQSWQDLLDPKWKAKVLLVDPTTSPAYIDFWYQIVQKHGIDYLEKLRAQAPRLYPGAVPVTESLAAGEGAVAVPDVGAVVAGAKDKGAPVEMVTPDLATGPEIVVGLSAEAKHPNAATLFAHFVLSEQGSALLNDDPGSVSPYDTENLPSEYARSQFAEAQKHKDEIYDAFGVD